VLVRLDRMPKRTKTVLALPEKRRTKLIRERKKVLEERAKRKWPRTREPFTFRG
jgi:hypothetical protein